MTVLHMLLAAWVSLFILMSGFWYLGKKKQNYSVVDIAWTIGLVVCAVIYYIMGEGNPERKAIITGMVIFWGVRLATHLSFRIFTHGEDARYTEFRKDYGDQVDSKFFVRIFQFQAIIDLVLSIPFLIVCIDPNPDIGILEIAGIVLFIIGVAGESVADYQLKHFKDDPANRSKNCEVGLWNYSRHPNYFFEWTIWVSYSLVCLASPFGYFGLLSPILMLLLFLKLTIALAENQSMKKRPEIYTEYRKTTNEFFPWFKKK